MDAQANIGFMYQHAQGVEQDNKKAMEWYKKACSGGLQWGCDNYIAVDQ